MILGNDGSIAMTTLQSYAAHLRFVICFAKKQVCLGNEIVSYDTK